jgi:hypothetical protein
MTFEEIGPWSRTTDEELRDKEEGDEMRGHETRFLQIAGLVFILLSSTLRVQAVPSLQSQASCQTPDDCSLLFVENVGQFAPSARFLVYGADSPLWLAEDGMWVIVESPASGDNPAPDPPYHPTQSSIQNRKRVAIRLTFPGANPHPRLEPFGRLPTRVSYFYGRDPAGWYADVPVWGGVRYRDLYPGVDLVIAGAGGRWTWRLNVRREDVGREVLLRIEGADAVEPAGEGAFRLSTSAGDFVLPLPMLEGANIPLSAIRVEQLGDGAFNISAPFSPGYPTSPEQAAPANPESGSVGLAYAAYLNGGIAYDVAVDSAADAYVTGRTSSPAFPTTPGVFGRFFNGGKYDAFVAKLNSAGTVLEYATFLGSPRDDHGNDFGYGIAIDANGNAYVTGWTDSDKFPVTSGAYDTTFNGVPHLDQYDVFVAKLSTGGTALRYATYLGGSLSEKGTGIAVDNEGNAYVTGWTASSDFPTAAAFSNFSDFHGGTADAFVAKLNSTGTDLVYGLLVGGKSEDISTGIAVNSNGYAYITGVTQSTDFPWRLALDYDLDGPSDIFVAYVRPTGFDLSYSTYLGGAKGDMAYDVSVDPDGNAYITGETDSTDFPVTAGSFNTSYNGGDRDAFVVKLSNSGRMKYAGYLGYSGSEKGYGIAADSFGNAYVTGYLGNDTVSKIDSDGTQLLFTLSGTGFTSGWSIAVDAVGSAYIIGEKDGDGWVVKAAEPSYVTGKVTDGEGHPLEGISIAASGKYTVTTGTDGLYSLVLAAGTYTMTPVAPGYFWSPPYRIVSVPPAATDQDFVGAHVQKEVTPDGFAEVRYGDVLTYTVGVVYPAPGKRLFDDVVPTHTTYISGSLSGPAGIAYDAGGGVVQGTLNITAGIPVTVTFAAQVVVTGTAEMAPTIVNRACIRPEGSGMDNCDWSNEVRSYTHVWPAYLPLVERE